MKNKVTMHLFLEFLLISSRKSHFTTLFDCYDRYTIYLNNALANKLHKRTLREKKLINVI